MHLYRDLKQFAKYPFDVLIIGGGFTGANIARDAAMRGLRVGLVEAGDFGQNMQAGAAKDVLDNIRYLTGRRFGFVRDSLRERTVWQDIAPHLVKTAPFVLPYYDTDDKNFGRIRNAFKIFDFLPLGPRPTGPASAAMASHAMVSAETLLRKTEGLRERHLIGGLSFPDVWLEQPARLCLEVLLSAAEHGAQIINHCEATEIVKSSTEVQGAVLKDLLTEQVATAKAGLVINAAGAQARALIRHTLNGQSKLKIGLKKTIQVVARSGASEYAMAIQSDCGAELVYLLPRGEFAIIGTSVSDRTGDPARATVEPSEVKALIESVNRVFPGALLSADDIVQAYAGVRALVAPKSAGAGQTPAAQSQRDHKADAQARDPLMAYSLEQQTVIYDHAKDGLSGFLTALGGKWSNARLLAARTVDVCLRKLKKPKQSCRTAKQPLFGARMDSLEDYIDIAIDQHSDYPAGLIEHLVGTYGSHYKRVLSFDRQPSASLSPSYQDIEAQVRYAVHHELAATVEDFVSRRSGLSTGPHPGDAAVETVGEIMQGELGWTEEECERLVQAAKTKLKSLYRGHSGAHMAA